MNFRLFLELMEPQVLYHGTSDVLLPSILKEGLKNPSWWGTEDVASYYAEEVAEEYGGGEIVLAVSLNRFNISKLEPDGNSIAEPLTYTLGKSEEELWDEWQKADGTWQDCYRIYGSVIYRNPIKITDRDIST